MWQSGLGPGPNLLPGLIAAADYSADGTTEQFGLYENLFVYLSAAGVVTVCDAEGQRALGVLLNRPKQYETADVAELTGLITVQCGDVVTAGNYVETADDGQAIPVTYGGGNTAKFVLGQAIITTTAAPGLVTILACTPHRAA